MGLSSHNPRNNVTSHLQGDAKFCPISFIQSVCFTLQLDNKELCKILKLTSVELQDIFSQKKELSYVNLCEFLDYFNLSHSCAIAGNVDLEHVKNEYQTNLKNLPKRYAENSFSRKRTVINILSFVEKYFGHHEMKLALKHFQLSQAHFVNPDQAISTLFCRDLMEYFFIQRKFPFEYAFYMGVHSFFTNQDSIIQKQLSSYQSIKELYEGVVQEFAHLWDVNHKYQLEELSGDGCIVSVTQKQEIKELLKVKKIGSIYVENMVAGVFASFPLYLGRGQAKFQHLGSVHRGDLKDTYLFEFNQ